MSSVSPSALAAPIALDVLGPGSVAYTLAPNDAFIMLALAFQVDLTSSLQDDDVWVELREPAGALLVGAVVGAGQAAGTIKAYTLAPDLNPCDGIEVSSALGLVPDTFPALPLVEGCKVTVQALKASDAGADANAAIGEAVMWVARAGGGDVLSGEPLFVPIPLGEQAA